MLPFSRRMTSFRLLTSAVRSFLALSSSSRRSFTSLLVCRPAREVDISTSPPSRHLFPRPPPNNPTYPHFLPQNPTQPLPLFRLILDRRRQPLIHQIANLLQQGLKLRHAGGLCGFQVSQFRGGCGVLEEVPDECAGYGADLAREGV